MEDFAVGIHPRVHFWSSDAPQGIPTVEDLRRRVMKSSGWKPQRKRWGGKLARRRREWCAAGRDD